MSLLNPQLPSFEKCHRVVSEIERPWGSFKTAWTVKGFKDGDAFDSIIMAAKSELKLKPGSKSFTFEFTLTKNISNRSVDLVMTLKENVSTCCELFDVEIYKFGKETALLQKKNAQYFNTGDSWSFGLFPYMRNIGYNTLNKPTWVATAYPDEQNIGIVITPIKFNGSPNMTEKPAKVANQSGIIQDFRRFYTRIPDNYSDLKLESNDGTQLKVHKFVVAARSEVLHSLIEDALKQNGFDGTIKLTNINGKPLMIMLHWVYTGELKEDAEKRAGELVKAALDYKLADLLECLDGELINICTPENMMELFQVALKSNLKLAKKQISCFIQQ